MIEINLADIIEIQVCADCDGPIGFDDGPPDGWQLEYGRTVCHNCCVIDTGRIIDQMIECGKRERAIKERDELEV